MTRAVGNTEARRRWRCSECYAISADADILIADNPFMSAATISGCPRCCAVESLSLVCAEATCTRDATCGGPAPKGYRHTCSEHRC